MSQQARSKSKSTPSKPNSNHKSLYSARTISLAVICLSVLALGFGIFQIYDIFQKSLDTSNIEIESYNNYFDQKTIDELRTIKDNRENITIPEGRINPFH